MGRRARCTGSDHRRRGALREACKPWQVQTIVGTRSGGARSLHTLADKGLPLEEFPQSPARITPPTRRFGEAVRNKALTHSGDPDLRPPLS